MLYRITTDFLPDNPMERDWVHKGLCIDIKILQDEGGGNWEVVGCIATGLKVRWISKHIRTGKIYKITLTEYAMALRPVTDEEIEDLYKAALSRN